MKAKKLCDLAQTIYDAFYQNSTGDNELDEILMNVFGKKISHIEETLNKNGFEKEEEDFGSLIRIEIPYSFFGLGFAVGQMLDLTEPKVQKTVKAIQREIRENGLLPYLPRERKGG